jgi:ornithine carbamoyltransferase
MKHILEIDDLSAADLTQVLALSSDERPQRVLEGSGAALIFEKPSNRTRNSMEMAVAQLGGHPVYIEGHEIGIDERETAEDVVSTLAQYHSVVCARVFDHGRLERMAAVDLVPVVNLLSDEAHPMQALADLLTLQREFGRLEGLTVAYVGDANNVWRSLALACAMTGATCRIAAPPDHQPSEVDIDRVKAAGADVMVSDRPAEIVSGADAVYTDVWASMGQKHEAAERRRAFEGFTVDAQLTAGLVDGGIVMHCLPAVRGEEISAEVLEGERSRVWAQAQNRMHAARGLLVWLLS